MKGTVLVFILLVTVLAVQADPRQWNPAGLSVRQGHHIQWQRTTAQDAAGNTIMVWADARNGVNDVYAQLISPAGALLWTAGGVNVTNQAPGRQESPAVCAVNGGWIVAWIDFRSDIEGDVWAQKLDNSGAALWTGNNSTGMPVDEFASAVNEASIRVVHDGSGGAIVAWEDTRRGDPGDIYAQRIGANGETAWTSALAVTDANGEQIELQVTGDGGGNMLAVWHDRRNPVDQNIYAAKITLDGQTPWGANGITVCAAPQSQSSPQICPDALGGWFIAWVDDRNQSVSFDDIYLQRLDANGTAQFAVNGIPLCTAPNNQQSIRLATSINNDAFDGCVVVWEDLRINNDRKEVYAQKISLAGVAQWAPNGILVCGDADPSGTGNTRENVVLASDLVGGLVCAWKDTRNTDNDLSQADLYAARVLAIGSLSWSGECGNLFADGPRQQYSPILQVTNTGVIAAFDDVRSGSQSLRIQELSLADGSRLLTPDGVVILSGLDYDASKPQAVAMSGARTAVVWEDARGYNDALFYQIVAANGQFEKDLNGVPLVPDGTGGPWTSQEHQRLCTDGSGGFFAVYEDNRTSTKMIRALHVNSAGDLISSPAGEAVYHDSTVSTDQVYSYCASDGQGGCYVAWSDYDVSYYIDAYVMRLDAQCHRLWQTPVRLTDTQDDDIIQGLVSDGAGSCIVVWRSGPWGTFSISTAKVNSDGGIAYNFSIGNTADYYSSSNVIADGQGGAYFVWVDNRNLASDRDIYTQRLNAQGEELWVHNGLLVNSDTLAQFSPIASLSGDGNLYVVWEDFRNGQQFQLFGQKLSPDGNLLWPAEGVLIAAGTGDQRSPAILPDNGNGLFVTWSGIQGNSDWWPTAYATHLGPEGDPVGDPYWVPQVGGALTNPIQQYQWQPAVAPDGMGGFVAVWTDQRSSGEEPLRDIYAQHISDAAGVNDHAPNLPRAFSLSQNYPNPFNPTTRISFALPKAGITTLKVYDLLGRQVTTLVDRSLQAGEHAVTFDASRLASGIYFYRLQSGSFSATRKLVLLK